MRVFICMILILPGILHSMQHQDHNADSPIFYFQNIDSKTSELHMIQLDPGYAELITEICNSIELNLSPEYIKQLIYFYVYVFHRYNYQLPLDKLSAARSQNIHFSFLTPNSTEYPQHRYSIPWHKKRGMITHYFKQKHSTEPIIHLTLPGKDKHLVNCNIADTENPICCGIDLAFYSGLINDHYKGETYQILLMQ